MSIVAVITVAMIGLVRGRMMLIFVNVWIV